MNSLIALAVFSSAMGAPASGLVVGVTDGDTLTVLSAQNERIKIRLAEIDAPESNQAFGARSKQSLSEICFGRKATFAHGNTDRYGRTISRILCDGVDAQAHQVRNGVAWVYDRFVTDQSLFGLQRAAKRDGRGLWSDPSPVPPWEFRRNGDGSKMRVNEFLEMAK